MTTINMTQALCLTLVHSLWQGFLAAVVAGIIILSTRRSRAALRYNLLTADLLLFLAVAGYTFFHELGGSSGPVRFGGGGVEETTILSGIQSSVQSGAMAQPGIVEQAGAFLHTHAATVVLVWMLCILGQLMQLTGGLYQLGQLRRRRVFASPAAWQERLQMLAAQLGIQKPVELVQSVRVSVPVTFGFLKPSILVPLGMLSNLPADQVETILLHELAHIRRSDYLANLLLHITEAVFFFNPGVRWIATLIREEREACCDDMVLMGAADQNSYFDALLAFREYAVAQQGYSLQLSNGKTDLLWRIRRMLNQENKKLHIMEKVFLSLGLTAVLALGLVSMRAAERQAEKRQLSAQHLWQITDTVPGMDTVPGGYTVSRTGEKQVRMPFPSISTKVEVNGATKQYKINATDAEGNTFELTKVNGSVTELIINGNVIPQGDFDQYLYIFDEIENRSHETAEEQEGDDRVAVLERQISKTQERLEEEQAKQQEVMEKQQEAQQAAEEKQQEAQQQALEKQQEAEEKQQQARQEAIEKQQEIEEKQREAQQQALEKQQEAEEKQREAQQERMEKQQQDEQQRLEKQQEALEKEQEARQEAQQVQQEKIRGAADRTINQIIGDMIEQGLVESKEAVHSFSLDSHGMSVNGTQMPEDTYQTFRDKYIKNANNHYNYRHHGTGTQVDVSTGN
jgi:bla regulator protein BlaR1